MGLSSKDLGFRACCFKSSTHGGARKSGMISKPADVDSGFEVSVFRA